MKEPLKWSVRIIGTGLAIAFGVLLVVVSIQGAASSFSKKPSSLTNHSPQGKHQETAPKGDYIPTDSSRGEALFQQWGCVGCHIDVDTPVAPTLHGVYGKRVEMEDGSKIQADNAYIAESILDPHVRIVKGYAPLMPPSYKDNLSDEDVRALVAYIKSLK
ncbi:MAG: hypothetical protein DSY55_03545 [Clostridia bacterium]|nr:MAG: hypothetical protein DSY55_03545 [Clostridia bacterium]